MDYRKDLFEKVKLKLCRYYQKGRKLALQLTGSSRVARGYLTLTEHFIDINWELQSLDHQDWEVAETLKSLLHTSAKVTTAMSGQDYPTASLREPLFGLILSNAEKLSEQMDARVEKT